MQICAELSSVQIACLSQVKCTSQIHMEPNNHCTSACASVALLLLLQGKELLSPGKNAMYNEEHKIVTPMNVGSLPVLMYRAYCCCYFESGVMSWQLGQVLGYAVYHV